MKRVCILIMMLALPALACNFGAGASSPLAPPPTVNLALPTSIAALGTVSPPPVLVTVVTATAVPATQPPAPTGTPCTLRSDWPTYTVQAGDTLFRIGQRSDATVDELVAANCLPDRNRLSVGQTLRVPKRISATPTPSLQPTRISDWSNPVVYPATACFQAPFARDNGVAVGERWLVNDGLTLLTLHQAAVVNKPLSALGASTPFTIISGPTCFTADYGSSTLVFRRWRIASLDGDISGWIDEIDPFTNVLNIKPDRGTEGSGER